MKSPICITSMFHPETDLLVASGWVAWFVFKEVIKTAIRVPQWFVKVNTTRPNGNDGACTHGKEPGLRPK